MFLAFRFFFLQETNPAAPRHIAVKKCVVSVQNRDDQLCFLYLILARIHRVEHERNPSRVCHYRPFPYELVSTGLSFPLAVKDVAQFERLNGDGINVMTFDERQPIPLYVTPHRQRKYMVNLMLMTDETNAHYCVLICNLSRLVSGRTKYDGKTFVCQSTLSEHISQCSVHAPQSVT